MRITNEIPLTLTLSPNGEGNKRCETIYLKIYSKVQRFGKDKLHYPKLDEKPKHN